MRHFQDLKMFRWEEDKCKFSKMENGTVLALKKGGNCVHLDNEIKTFVKLKKFHSSTV